MNIKILQLTSANFPWDITAIISAFWMVDRRWAMTSTVRPSRQLSKAACTTASDSASKALKRWRNSVYNQKDIQYDGVDKKALWNVKNWWCGRKIIHLHSPTYIHLHSQAKQIANISNANMKLLIHETMIKTKAENWKNVVIRLGKIQADGRERDVTIDHFIDSFIITLRHLMVNITTI